MRTGSHPFLKITALAALGLAFCIAVFREPQPLEKNAVDAPVHPSPFEPVAGRPTATVEKQLMTYAETRLVIHNRSKLKMTLKADEVSCTFHYFDEADFTNRQRTYRDEKVAVKNKDLALNKTITLIFPSAGKCVEEINCDVRLTAHTSDTIAFEKEVTERVPKQGCIAEAHVNWTATRTGQSNVDVPAQPVDENLQKMLTTNFVETLQGAKMTSFVENGEPAGVLLEDVKSGSLFEMAGLQDGDVINQINETKILDAADLSGLVFAMQNKNSKLTIRRNGETIEMIY